MARDRVVTLSFDGKVATVRGLVLEADQPQISGNIYSKALIQQIVSDATTSVSNRVLFGMSGPRVFGMTVTPLKDISHVITKFEVEPDGSLIAEAQILQTLVGKKLFGAIVDAHKPFRFNALGMGSLSGRVVQLDYVLGSIDLDEVEIP